MTEAEWLACKNPESMLRFMPGTPSNRKRRLFAVACCRHVWHLLTDPCCREAVEVAERYADGLERKSTLAAARARARRVALAQRGTAYAAWRAALEKQGPVTIHVALTAVYAASEGRAYGPGWERSDHAWHSAVVSDLARDVFGNPYRPRPHIIPLSTDQANVAKSIYESRDFGLMPILADALEEAGAPDEVVSHLRSPGPHVRGCWALDLALGLE